MMLFHAYPRRFGTHRVGKGQRRWSQRAGGSVGDECQFTL
jgi:hypothetical protein